MNKKENERRGIPETGKEGGLGKILKHVTWHGGNQTQKTKEE